MERALKLSIGILVLFVTTSCFANLNNWGFKPNIGFDAGARKQGFERENGHEQFREHYPDLNLYIGTKIHRYFGIEAGYEEMFRQQQWHYYPEDTPGIMGFLPPLENERVYASNVSSKGWNLTFDGFYPICPRTKTDLIGIIGLAWLKMYYETVLFEDPVNPANPLATWHSGSRAMFRAGLGLRQMITKHFGMRLLWVYENTSKLEATMAVPVGQGGAIEPTELANNYTAIPKNSHLLTLGFFLQAT